MEDLTNDIIEELVCQECDEVISDEDLGVLNDDTKCLNCTCYSTENN